VVSRVGDEGRAEAVEATIDGIELVDRSGAVEGEEQPRSMPARSPMTARLTIRHAIGGWYPPLRRSER
jgi:hypothetical protein